MAENWIKVRCNLRTHPKVGAMARELKTTRAHVIGCLVVLWQLADEHATDGLIPLVDRESIDNEVGLPGFCVTVERFNWLECVTDGVVLPRYEAHNGSNAKDRANTAARVSRFRHKDNDSQERNGGPLPDKIREDKKRIPPKSPKGDRDEAAPKGAGPSSPKGDEDAPAGFLRFWSEYPDKGRKADRANCLRRWERRKLEGIAEQVIAGLRRWKVSRDWTREDGRFICAPLVWLNQARWEAKPESAAAESPEGDWSQRPPTDDELRRAFGEEVGA